MVEPIFKEPEGLEIETGTQMEKLLRWLLFRNINFARKSFILMYLTRPREVYPNEAGVSEVVTQLHCKIVQVEGFG